MSVPLAILWLMLAAPAELPGLDRLESPDLTARFIVSQLAQTPQKAAPHPDEAEQQRRQNTVTVGVLILVGVAAIGLLLIAGALIWGAKVRRMVRPTEVEPTRHDDLWYLRKGKQVVGDTEESADDGPPIESPEPPRISDTDDTRS